jgi:cell division septal protein FtsQ
VLILAAIGGGTFGWAAASWRVEQIRVLPTAILSPDAVIRASGLRGGERILLTRLGDVEARVARLPGVADASIVRRLPATVEIRVRERRPLAILEGTTLAVDADAVVVPVPDGSSLPVAEGFKARPVPGRPIGAAWKAVLGAYGRFPAPLAERIGRIVVSPGALVMHTRDGIELRFGPLTDLGAKASAATSVLAHADEAGLALAYVDLRVPQTPVSGDRPPARPASAPRTGT